MFLLPEFLLLKLFFSSTHTANQLPMVIFASSFFVLSFLRILFFRSCLHLRILLLLSPPSESQCYVQYRSYLAPCSLYITLIQQRFYDYTVWEFGCFWDLFESKTTSFSAFYFLHKSLATTLKCTQIWGENLFERYSFLDFFTKRKITPCVATMSFCL